MRKYSFAGALFLCCFQGAAVALGATNVGVVTEVSSTQVRGIEQSIITTSDGSTFIAHTQYTNVAEKGATLVLIVSGNKSKYLCNVKGGACARVQPK